MPSTHARWAFAGMKSARGEASARFAHGVDERGEIGLGRRVVQDARAQRETVVERRLRQEGGPRGLHVLHHTLVERVERVVITLQARWRVTEAHDRKLDVAEPLEIGCGV